MCVRRNVGLINSLAGVVTRGPVTRSRGIARFYIRAPEGFETDDRGELHAKVEVSLVGLRRDERASPSVHSRAVNRIARNNGPGPARLGARRALQSTTSAPLAETTTGLRSSSTSSGTCSATFAINAIIETRALRSTLGEPR